MEVTQASTFGRLLRRFRRDAELTQEELAERAGLSVRGIGYLERDLSHAPYQATVLQLADALELAPADRAALLTAARRRPQRSIRLPPITSVHPTPLLGRDGELNEISRTLEQPHVRLLTVLGPGGVGKTRLALEVAAHLQDRFAGGAAVVPLATLRDPGLVTSTIAQVLVLREAADRTVTESLLSYLREKQVLLLLDNLEHLLPAAASLAQLIAACPQLRLLVTSRAPLRMQGEHEYPIGPLATPDPKRTLPADVLDFPAIELFVQRATAVRREFRMSCEHAGAVAEICYRLDGLPLAIELAATRIKLFPPPALLKQLDRRLHLLTDGPRDVPARLRTMRDAIAWSYDLLSPEEQAVFARLSVFVGGCSFKAAETVCNPDPRFALMDELASLVDQSLVRQEGQEEPRFLMLETIRQYAYEKLQERGEDEGIKAVHAQYFSRLAQDAEPELIGGRQAARLAQLTQELDNVRAALGWLLDHEQIEEELRLAAALFDFWRMAGHWSEGLRWLEDGLNRGEAVSNRTRAKALGRAGTLSIFLGDYERATQWLEEALDLARSIGNVQETAWLLRHLGTAQVVQGNAAAALRLAAESL